MPRSWERVPFGSTEMRVAPLGLGASYGYGLTARDIERAVERGVNYIYWGSTRVPVYAEAVRNLGPSRRGDLVIVVQNYSRLASLVRPDLESALRKLRTDYTDLLLLGWGTEAPSRKSLDAALALKEAGKTRAILVACHHRPAFASYIDDPTYDGIMVRYNAAHPGAEREVFPHLARRKVGVVSYTATRWGALIDRRYTPPGERVPRASDCYRFVLSNPHVDVCLAGPADAAQLDEALGALDKGPLSEDELAWMLRVGAHVRETAKKQIVTRVRKLADRMATAVNRLTHVIER
ncbi:hypothetical protein WME94_45600 [Sorangium sp. So ce429]